ncbi:uncharacterized protein OCT59_026659 [Rhizophagus irregularis]|nr:hypothetical protein OCT59_026659 [Rhizophagus irregularis]GBC16547.2 hypothetical protein RIR_jg32421.t1 [Rhizophagus irregularis DAOM 181602=DAOM 197198]CAB4494430.1 unnamed protein product [Rhizophagus irregularis]CAG8743438.1 4655_t:CDS:2 [Rhizophagus irregularis]
MSENMDMSESMNIDNNDIKNDPEIAQLIEYLKAKKSAATTTKSPPETIVPSTRNFNRPVNHIKHFKQMGHPYMKSSKRIRHKEDTHGENEKVHHKKSKITDEDPTKIVYNEQNEDNQFFDKKQEDARTEQFY